MFDPPIRKSADKKVLIKSADKKYASKTLKHKEGIINLAKEKGEIKSADLLDMLDVGETWARTLLRELVADGTLVSEGGNRNKVYKLS